MILDNLSLFIKEDLEGEINIRGYKIKISIENYPFRLKVSHLAKPVKYILQELFPEKYKVSEKEQEFINMGYRIDKLAGYIWNELANFYREDIVYLKIDLSDFDPPLVNLGKKLVSIFSLIFSLGLKPHPYSSEIRGESPNIPLNIGVIKPDILLEGKYKVIGDVKYGTYRNEYKNVIAAYAMIYESIKKEDIDYGILIHIDHNFDINLYFFKINDRIRSETIELIKNKYEEVNRVLKDFNSLQY